MGCGKMKSGGPVKKVKMQKGGALKPLGAKIGVGVNLAGMLGTGVKAVIDKIKEKNQKKKAVTEKNISIEDVKRIGGAKYKSGGELYGMPQENLGTSGQYGFAKKGGIIKKKSGGPLKPVDKSNNPGLAKLPTAVRNKMGYMKKGGVKKK
jgi:hypothetical protein